MNPRRDAALEKSTLRRSEKVCTDVAESAAWQKVARALPFPPLRRAPIPAERDGFPVAPTLRVESELSLFFIHDLRLVPSLAFSRDNHRLGRRASAAYTLAVCDLIQLREVIPSDSHDVTLDAVITD